MNYKSNFQENKYFLKEGILSIIVHSIGLITSFGLNIFILKSVGVVDYGKYSKLLSVINILSAIAIVGSDLLIKKYFPIYLQEKNWYQLKSLLFYIVKNILIFFTICLLPFFVITDYFDVFLVDFYVERTLIIIISLVLVFTFYRIIISILEALDKVVIANFIKRVLFPLIFIISIIFLNIVFEFENNYESIIQLRILVLSFFSVTLSIFIFSKYNQLITTNSYHSKNIWIYSNVFLFLIQLSQIFTNNIDNIIIGEIIDDKSVSIYKVCCNLAGFILFGFSSLNVLLSPKISRFFKNKEFLKLESHINLISIIGFIIGLLIFIIFLIFSNTILLYFGPEFVSAKKSIYVLVITFLIHCLLGPSLILMMYTKLHKEACAILFLSLALKIIFNIIMVPTFGIYGAALASSITGILSYLLMTYYIMRKIKINPTAFLFLNFRKS